MAEAPIVSHGRGGTLTHPYPVAYGSWTDESQLLGLGNIGADATEYVPFLAFRPFPFSQHRPWNESNTKSNETRYADAEIVREGTYGDQGDGAYSAGVRLRSSRFLPSFNILYMPYHVILRTEAVLIYCGW